MTRYRRLLPLLLLSGLGCAPDGPSDFYRETLQARSELADTLTFIVDEQSAARLFPPAYKILHRRTETIRDAFESWDKKTTVRNGFDVLMRDSYKPSDIGSERREDMRLALHAYDKFCKEIVYVNTRLSREIKRIELTYKASLAQLADSDGAADLPALTNVIDTLYGLRNVQPPRIFSKNMTQDLLERLKEDRIDAKFMTTVDPNDFFAPLPGFTSPPPPAAPDGLSGTVDRLADRVAKLPSQLPAANIVAIYQDEKPRQQSLKNESGKVLTKVSGLLVIKMGADTPDRWVPIKIADWRTDPVAMPVNVADNLGKMRLIFQAEMEGGGQVGYDQPLPVPPPPKRP